MGHNESSGKKKYIALSASKKKLGRAYTSSLTAHLNALEQKAANTPKTAGNNQTQGWNQPNRNKKNYTKNQPNQELVLWENHQEDKPLAILTTGHRDSILINKIRNEKRDITTEFEEIQKKSSDPTTKGYTQQNWKT